MKTSADLVVKNAGWIIGAQIVKSLLGLVISMITARYLGPSNYGLINYASSIVAFVVPIVYLGLSNTLVQEIISDSENSGEILGTSISMSFLSSLCCILGIFAFTLIANPGEEETTIVCVLYSVLLVFQSVDLIQYWFQANLLSKYSSVISLIAYVVVSAYKIFLLITRKSIRWFAISNAIDVFAISSLMIIVYIKLSGQKLSFSYNRARSLFSKSKYYIIANMMVAVFAQTDKIMIKIMIDDTSNGLYSAGVACAGMTGFVFSAIIDSFRPMIFSCKKENEQQYESSLCSLYSIIIWGALLQSVFFCIFSGFIINILYGDSYSGAVDVLRIITWYSTFSYLGAIRNIWMLAENKQKYLWIINLSGALGNVVLNLILIPVCGIIGAAVASLATQFFTNVIMGFIMRPIRYCNTLMIRSLKPKYILNALKKGESIFKRDTT